MIFHTRNQTIQRIGKSIALLTFLALLNAMSVPMICGLGWCTPSDKADCCSTCESSKCDSSPPDRSSCTETACPFANTGACTGLVFLHETEILPVIVETVEPIVMDYSTTYPIGYTFDLIRPPAASC